MSEEILINVTPPETRVAVVENGVVQELMIERASNRGVVGNIYKGMISRVMPGMQSAFVDIGLERAAFLHVNDIHQVRNGQLDGDQERSIQDYLLEGQELVVQVIKDPIGSKGARLTTQISIPSRHLVLMPHLSNIGVSQKIEDHEERTRLREILSQFDMSEWNNAGFIARTAAEGVTQQALVEDKQYLSRVWHSILDRMESSRGISLIHEDLPLYLRAIRDLVTPDVEKIRIDSRRAFQQARDFATTFIPELRASLEYYPGERPIFDLFGVEDEIDKAIQRKVQLKSGGYLIIDQTEAMTTIDVNTGNFLGHRNLEETIFKTNLEATQVICRQLRLRNLGGIIIIDFIDMQEQEHKRQVIRALEKYLSRDHAKTHISEVSSLGLVEMTRKRTRESLEHILCESCPSCRGRGFVKTRQTVAYEIFREIIREARQFEVDSFLVLASTEVVDFLLDTESHRLSELEEFIDKTIKLQPEALYAQENYDIVLI